MEKIYSNVEVVKLAKQWLEKKESDGSFKEIIDIYNSYSPLPRNVKMKYDWEWCACTWSALAIKLGYTDIMPIEISCGELIKKAQKMGIWEECDGFVPFPGDAVLYDWDDNGKGDNTGWPDHIGVVDYVNTSSGYFTVIEGNYNGQVKKRTVSINGKFIRGFICPNYHYNHMPEEDATGKTVREAALDVIAGKYGTGSTRSAKLKEHGFDPKEVQKIVNEILNIPKQQPLMKKVVNATCNATRYQKIGSKTFITTADLYCRNDAGTNKKALCCIPRGTKVTWYGYYTPLANIRWFLVQVTLNGITYTGFCSSQYLK